MKRLIIFLMLLAVAGAVKAQTNPYIVNGTITTYTASSSSAALLIVLNVDSNTKWADYINTPPNRQLDNHVFLRGTKKIRLTAVPAHRKTLKTFGIILSRMIAFTWLPMPC